MTYRRCGLIVSRTVLLDVRRLSRLCRVLAVASLLFLGATGARAQSDQDTPPLPVDPTPLDRLLSPAEKASVADPGNPKKNVEQYLKISEAHLDSASNAIKNGDFHTAERELDIYNKALAEACKIGFAIREGKRGVSKKIEQSLYKQIRTLESIERMFPSEREMFAEAALKHAKRLRVQALNEAFAGGDVLKDPDQEKKETHNVPDGEGASIKTGPIKPALMRVVISPSYARRKFTKTSAQFDSTPRASLSHAARLWASQIPGDYLTEEEDGHVREAQKADDRIKVFMKIADRRIAGLKGDSEPAADAKAQKKLEEEARNWGVIPKLPRADLLRHYARAIEECMAKLEDAYERNPKSSAIPKALVSLRDATERHLQALRALTSDMKTEKEIGALRDAIEQAETANKGARDGLKGKE
jgi:hypothetical protein